MDSVVESREGKASTSGTGSSHAPSGNGKRVRWRTNMKNTIVMKVLKARPNWVESPDPVRPTEEDAPPRFDYGWDLYWGELNTFLPDNGFYHSQLREGQKINHFPRNYELCRKDLMAKNLKRARRALEKQGRGAEFDFIPVTYTLPSEWGIFVEEYKNGKQGLWIAKPAGRAQGKGIFLVDKLSQLATWKKQVPAFNDRVANGGGSRPRSGQRRAAADDSSDEEAEIYVVQRYVDRPLLVAGRKFDMRIYVLTLSYTPLHVYLHRGGFCRFTGERFSMQSASLTAHLTNNAVQKKLETFDRHTANKWPLRNLRMYLTSRHGRAAADRAFEGIQEVILKSLEAVQHVVVQDSHSFELYGYDIMLQDDLKPILIEVNAQPSLSYDTQADRDLKFEVVNDALTLVDFEGRYCREAAGKEREPAKDAAAAPSAGDAGPGGPGPRPASLGGYDLICHRGRRVRPHPTIGCMLGMAWGPSDIG